MIDLNIQIKLIIFSFIFGFFFSVLFEIFNKVTNKYKNYLKLFFSFFIIMIATYIYFEGISIIGNAILHIFSIFSIVLGFFTYDLLLKLIANNNKK